MKKIDIQKKYKTRDGHVVEDLNIVTHNKAGRKVTYPVKGTLVLKDKPRKTEYEIWTEYGKYDAVWGDHKWDLVEDKGE